MEKPDQVCDLGRLQHLPIGKVQQEVGNDGCGGQGQEHHARVPGARLRAHGNPPWKRERRKPEAATQATAESGERALTTEPQEQGVMPTFDTGRRCDLGSHVISLSLSFLCEAEKIPTS